MGAGIIGLAVARELTRGHPRASVCVLEREAAPAGHQSAHNSGVVHAGIYYRPGSLKARLCVEGAREMYEYCERAGVQHERCGKLIVATERSELKRLQELELRAHANGVRAVRTVQAAQLQEIEPHARGIAALHSPDSGIVDYRAVTGALARELAQDGATVACGCEVTAIRAARGALVLEHRRGSTEARHAVFCAGAWADRLARLAGACEDPRIVPFRGAYLRLAAARAKLVRGLIYPVPDPALPFLGVHLTRTVAGEVLIGPTALPAASRAPRARWRAAAADVLDAAAWPGTWRMLARWWRPGLEELAHALSRRSFVRAAARYVPELEPEDVEPAFAGVRAQAVGRDGSLIDDFVFSRTERAIHVRNAPSPGATASLAIARHIAQEAERELGM